MRIAGQRLDQRVEAGLVARDEAEHAAARGELARQRRSDPLRGAGDQHLRSVAEVHRRAL
jgi:hypothetical protein